VTAPRRPRPPRKELRISDLETLRVLADPLRLRILEAFGHQDRRPLSVKEVARALEEPLTKLYYHVNLMEQHGLLVVASSRLVSGILEKRYLPAAERFEIDKGILGAGTLVAHEAMRSVVSSVFAAAQSDIEAAVHAGRARIEDEAEDADAGDDREPVLLSKGLDRLTRAEAAEFRRRLRALYEEFGRHSDEDREHHDRGRGKAAAGRRPFGLVLAFYPIADAPTTSPRRTRRAQPEVDR
jgi:hypothetical protein